MWELAVAAAWAGVAEAVGEAHVRAKRSPSHGIQSMASVLGWAVIQIAICICCFICFRKICQRRAAQGQVIAIAQPRPASYPMDNYDESPDHPYPQPQFFPSGPLGYPSQPGGPGAPIFFQAPGQEGPKYDVPPPSYDEAVSLPQPSPRLPPLQRQSTDVSIQSDPPAYPPQPPPPCVVPRSSSTIT